MKKNIIFLLIIIFISSGCASWRTLKKDYMGAKIIDKEELNKVKFVAYNKIMSTKHKDDFQLFAVSDGDVVCQVMVEGYVVAAIEPEFPAFEFYDCFFQGFGGFVFPFLFSSHDVLQ